MSSGYERKISSGYDVNGKQIGSAASMLGLASKISANEIGSAASIAQQPTKFKQAEWLTRGIEIAKQAAEKQAAEKQVAEKQAAEKQAEWIRMMSKLTNKGADGKNLSVGKIGEGSKIAISESAKNCRIEMRCPKNFINLGYICISSDKDKPIAQKKMPFKICD